MLQLPKIGIEPEMQTIESALREGLETVHDSYQTAVKARMLAKAVAEKISQTRQALEQLESIWQTEPFDDNAVLELAEQVIGVLETFGTRMLTRSGNLRRRKTRVECLRVPNQAPGKTCWHQSDAQGLFRFEQKTRGLDGAWNIQMRGGKRAAQQ